MAYQKKANSEPIPGYRLVERIGIGGCGEVWKCEAPGGIHKAIKFVYSGDERPDNMPVAEELRAIELIKTIRHPYLLSLDRVEKSQGELLIVSELADCNLQDVLQQCQADSLPGIPRKQLLDYLRESAEVLDLLNHQHGLQHLDVKPHNLFLVSNHIKVGDFGLVNSLTGSGTEPAINSHVGPITPLYASPELFHNRMSPYCDQYSLAVTYQELLTGLLPFDGKTSRQMLMMHTTQQPNLSALPEQDKPIIARALAKKPEDRFPSCMDLIVALQKTQTATDTLSVPAQLQTESKSEVRITTPSLPQPIRKRKTISGFRLDRCLGSTPVMEVWQGESRDGEPKLIKLLFLSHIDQSQLQENLRVLQSLEHPILNPFTVDADTSGQILLVSDLVETHLRNELQKNQSRQLQGIPRVELLDLLRPVANGLDALYRLHSVQHLGLNPKLMLLDQGRVVLDEYGIVQLIRIPGERFNSQFAKRYAAPELLHNQISPFCDQYSLSLIYLEMLNGHIPRIGGNSAQGGEIDLEQIDKEERDVIARALSSEPQRRWPSCSKFIEALENCKSGFVSLDPDDEFTTLIKTTKEIYLADAREPDPEEVQQFHQLILDLAQTSIDELTPQSQQSQIVPDSKGTIIRDAFTAGLPLGTVRMKLDALREELDGQLFKEDTERCVFRIEQVNAFRLPLFRVRHGLQVAVKVERHQKHLVNSVDVIVEVVPYGCKKKRGQQLLNELGMSILEQIRSVLLFHPENRVQGRLLWPYPIRIAPILEDQSTEEVIDCRGKDISLTGVGFYLPTRLQTSSVRITLPATKQTNEVSLPATIIRAEHCGDDWYEVGALFRLASGGQQVPQETTTG